jgi:hypothetical protein
VIDAPNFTSAESRLGGNRGLVNADFDAGNSGGGRSHAPHEIVPWRQQSGAVESDDARGASDVDRGAADLWME